MKKITSFVAATAVAASLATGAFAGSAGPVGTLDDEIMPLPPVGSGMGAGAIAAGLGAVLLVAAIVASNDDDASTGSTAE